jgi:sulfonate dioxygenase
LRSDLGNEEPLLINLDSAIVDYLDDDYGAKARHIFRLIALGEKPIPVYEDEEEEDEVFE